MAHVINFWLKAGLDRNSGERKNERKTETEREREIQTKVGGRDKESQNMDTIAIVKVYTIKSFE